LAAFLFSGLLIGCSDLDNDNSSQRIDTDGWDVSASVAAARALQTTLDPGLAAVLNHEFEVSGNLRQNWSNIPAGPLPIIFGFERNGIRLGDLNEEQLGAVFAFLEASLSTEGYEKVRQIVRADEMLAPFDVANVGWSEENYWLAFFGSPSTTDLWAWQFGGHHLAVNVSVKAGQVAASPSFIGIEPSRYEDQGVQFQPMEREVNLGLALVQALDGHQQSLAIVTNRPEELYTGAGNDGVVPPIEGTEVADMTISQQKQLTELIRLWVGLMPDKPAQQRLDTLVTQFDETYFAWHGPIDGSGSIYYRIQGPSLIIEFSAQGNIAQGSDASHYHSIYRNTQNEYGVQWPDS